MIEEIQTESVPDYDPYKNQYLEHNQAYDSDKASWALSMEMLQFEHWKSIGTAASKLQKL